jgi:hypothetical protein
LLSSGGLSLKNVIPLTPFLNLSLVLLVLFVGYDLVGQDFNPRPISDLVPGGIAVNLR